MGEEWGGKRKRISKKKKLRGVKRDRLKQAPERVLPARLIDGGYKRRTGGTRIQERGD